jgi:transposase
MWQRATDVRQRSMKPFVSDDLWLLVEPLLPKERRPNKKGGRPRISNRRVLTGILFILRTALPWQLLPLEIGCGSGSTCLATVQDVDTARGLAATPRRAPARTCVGRRD